MQKIKLIAVLFIILIAGCNQANKPPSVPAKPQPEIKQKNVNINENNNKHDEKNITPSEKSGPYILINKKENKLYFFRDGKLIKEYPVSTGKMDWYTPEGIFTIVNKIPYPKGKDPKAPMGPRWMGLAVPYEADRRGNNVDGGLDPRSPVGEKFGIHGTNDESTIGTHASGGCIRMYNKSVIELYDMVPIGTKVKIVAQ